MKNNEMEMKDALFKAVNVQFLEMLRQAQHEDLRACLKSLKTLTCHRNDGFLSQRERKEDIAGL
jgi:hypothetical protein